MWKGPFSALLWLLYIAFVLFKLWVLYPGLPETLPSVVIVLVPGIAGLAYDLWKRLTPRKPNEQLTEPESVTFDVDAAMARYMAAREEGGNDPPLSPPAPPPPSPPAQARPAFGRRGL